MYIARVYTSRLLIITSTVNFKFIGYTCSFKSHHTFIEGMYSIGIITAV